MHQNIDLDQAADYCNKYPGIDISKLAVGTELIVTTSNTIYSIEILNPEEKLIKISGGYLIPWGSTVVFQGSSWGGSVLRLNWIGFGMMMEFIPSIGKSIKTTEVVRAKIIGKDYDYQMEWPEPTENNIKS